MRTNLVVTIAGIMAALGGVPVAVATLVKTTPSWWTPVAFPLTLVGIIGVALLGWAAKGQDVHSTSAQVATSTIQNPDIEQKAIMDATVKK
jgi:hypothetical protein